MNSNDAIVVVLKDILLCLLDFRSIYRVDIFRSQRKYRATLEFKCSGCTVSNNLNYDCQSQSKLSQNHLTHVLFNLVLLLQTSLLGGNK